MSFATCDDFIRLRRFNLTMDRLYSYFNEHEFQQVFNNLTPIKNFNDATTPTQLGYLASFIASELNEPLSYNIFNCRIFYHIIELILPDFEKLENKFMEERQETFLQLSKLSKSYIYKISNLLTGQCYIGKTCKPPTNRWYQHFSQPGNSKFHKAVKNSQITDWTFNVIEEIKFPLEIYQESDATLYINERENFWIAQYNAVEVGYNSI